MHDWIAYSFWVVARLFLSLIVTGLYFLLKPEIDWWIPVTQILSNGFTHIGMLFTVQCSHEFMTYLQTEYPTT